MSTTKKNKVFISHSSLDYRESNNQIIRGNAISAIIKVLDDNKIERWVDEDGLLSAQGWCQQIKDAIENCNVFLFVSSSNSNKSENTANEIMYALKNHKHIIPFLIDDSPIHKDISLNLIRLHELHYYKDRNKALKDLVTTITGIQTDSIVSYTYAIMDSDKYEESINGEFISKKVLYIFNSQDINLSSNTFFFLFDLLCVGEKGRKVFLTYLNRLKNLATERNPSVKISRIENLIAQIKDDTSVLERHVKLLSILYKMYLYFLISDIKEVYEIQKEVNDVSFDLTFWEENADPINDIADGIIRIGGFFASAVAVVMGKGGRIARSTLIATTRTKRVDIVKTKQEVFCIKKSFETLKNAILLLEFNQ